MPSRTVFHDEDSNELQCYINANGMLYISAGPSDDEIGSGCIVLDKQDVQELIKVLTKLEEEME